MTKTFSSDKFKILSGSALKLIAVITMLIDHSAIILAPEITAMQTPIFTIGSQGINLYFIMRKIGRLAFPIFCFLIAEGFSHTRNQKRYALNLLLFAAISEIPYNLMHSGTVFNLRTQNIFFTLFLGVVMLYVYKNIDNRTQKAILLLAVAALTLVMNMDYGLRGVLLILMIYILKEQPAVQAVLAYPFLSGGVAAWLAFVPINMYNGKRGFIKGAALKYAFYIFYPLHILVLLGIRFILGN